MTRRVREPSRKTRRPIDARFRPSDVLRSTSTCTRALSQAPYSGQGISDQHGQWSHHTCHTSLSRRALSPRGLSAPGRYIHTTRGLSYCRRAKQILSRATTTHVHPVCELCAPHLLRATLAALAPSLASLVARPVAVDAGERSHKKHSDIDTEDALHLRLAPDLAHPIRLR